VDEEYMNNLRFGDNMVLIRKRAEELQKMYDKFIKESNKIRLERNLGKQRR